MELTHLFGLAVCFIASVSHAIKCKCTKESSTVKCVEGACEVEGGACLMLDHPVSGVHYTCHMKPMNDKECYVRKTATHHSVDVCGCNGEDLCNESYWPHGVRDADSDEHETAKSTTHHQKPQATVSPCAAPLLLPAIALVAQRLL